ncbi:MAG: VOC family protein [Gaiellaceae bacterium]
MEVSGIDHVGVAVADLDDGLSTSARLSGSAFEHRQAAPERGVEAVLPAGDRVELLASFGEDSPPSTVLAGRGAGRRHVADVVSHLRATLADLVEQGAQLIDPAPRRGLFGLEVSVVHPDAAQPVPTEVVGRG